MKKHKFLLLATITLYSGFTSSQELKSLNLKSNRVAMNSPTELSVEFKENKPQVWCGASIDWGDGVKQDIRLGDEGLKTSPLTFSHTYTLSGTFNISVQGKTLVRGLATAIGCDGSPPITRVSVIDVEALKAQQQQAAAAAAAEAKKKEELLAIEKAKKEADDRQRLLAEKELELKRRELEIKEEMLKKEEELRKKSAQIPPTKPSTQSQSSPNVNQPSTKPSLVKPADAF